jgi:hypothetical protein
MKTLVKTIKFYSDGTYEEVVPEVEGKPQDLVAEDLDAIFGVPTASTRIKVNVAVYTVAKRLYANADRDYYNKAISIVTQYQKVSRPTTCDKLYRQLELTSSAYQKLVIAAIEKDQVKPYRDKLLQFSGTYTGDDDSELINRFIADKSR